MFIALVASVGVINLLLTVVCCRTRSSCGMRCLDALSTVLMCTGPFAHLIIECTATLFAFARWWWRSNCEMTTASLPFVATLAQMSPGWQRHGHIETTRKHGTSTLS